jgi:DNA-directed RNA polymerase subunit RPC12/RpoP
MDVHLRCLDCGETGVCDESELDDVVCGYCGSSKVKRMSRPPHPRTQAQQSPIPREVYGLLPEDKFRGVTSREIGARLLLGMPRSRIVREVGTTEGNVRKYALKLRRMGFLDQGGRVTERVRAELNRITAPAASALHLEERGEMLWAPLVDIVDTAHAVYRTVKQDFPYLVLSRSDYVEIVEKILIDRARLGLTHVAFAKSS